MDPLKINQLFKMKETGEKITMLTAYDYSTAKIADEAGIDILLVGDSLAMVVLGYENTLPVTMSEMLHHTKAVSRATKRAIVVGDMPFLSYKVNMTDSVYNAGKFIKVGGGHAVKLEGGVEICEMIEAIIRADIPVMGHIGLTPQAIHKVGGYKVAGRTVNAATKLKNDALSLVTAGVFAIVLECLPYELAQEITESIPIPTIGIGAGPYCDGQVLVLHDLLGIYDKLHPKFVKKYLDGYKLISDAIKKFTSEVKDGTFPTLEHSYK